MDYRILEMVARSGTEALFDELARADKELVRIVRIAIRYDDRACEDRIDELVSEHDAKIDEITSEHDAEIEAITSEHDALVGSVIPVELYALARRLIKSNGKPEKVEKAIRKWKDGLESKLDNPTQFYCLLNCLENLKND